MSKKPVNFYQGAKGTFEVEIIPNETIIDGGTVIGYKATHTFAEIKQAIADGFLPYCVIKGDQTVYHILYNYNDSDDSGHVMFTSEVGIITIRYNNTVKVEEKESGGSGGSDDVLRVTITEANGNYSSDIPPKDILTACNADKFVYCVYNGSCFYLDNYETTSATFMTAVNFAELENGVELFSGRISVFLQERLMKYLVTYTPLRAMAQLTSE